VDSPWAGLGSKMDRARKIKVRVSPGNGRTAEPRQRKDLGIGRLLPTKRLCNFLQVALFSPNYHIQQAECG